MKEKLFAIFEILIWAVLFFVPVLFVSSLLHPDLDVKKTYAVYFYDINGIIVGSPVNFSGYNIGYVKKIKIEDNKVRLDLAITKDEFDMPRCTEIKIEETGLGGSRSLELSTCKDPYKPSGAYTTRPKKLNDILADVDSFSKNLVEGMSNLYLGLNAGLGGKDHQDFVELQTKLNLTENNLKDMSNDLTKAKIKAQKKLPEINRKMEKTLEYVSSIDINPEKIKAQATTNQQIIDKAGKNISKYSPAQYKSMVQNLYWRTEYLKYIDKDKVYQDIEHANDILNSMQNIIYSIESKFSSEELQKKHEQVENIRKDTENLLKEDF